MNDSLVVARRLSKTYPGTGGQQVGALCDVDLTIQRGEFVAVMGPSGSGKTTLLNLLGVLDLPTAGTLVVDGVDVSRLRGDELADFRRRTVGFVFQLFNLVPVLTALENVKLPLLPYRPRDFDLDGRAQELLAQVGLVGRFSHLPGQLSGGEQQRVAVARALINTPRLLLADEPTGNLDSRAGAELMELFERLNEQGTTIVMVTHDEAVAARAGRIVELRDGRVVNC